MKLYYDMLNQWRVDAGGLKTLISPKLRYKEKPEWEIQCVDASNAPVNLSGIAAWRAAVDRDFSNATAPMCRSIGNAIDSRQAALGIIKVNLNTNTTSFAAAVDGKSTAVKSYFELWGLAASGDPVFYLQMPVDALGVVDPDGGDLPAAVDNGLCSITEIEAAVLARYPLIARLSVNAGGALCLDGEPVCTGGAAPPAVTVSGTESYALSGTAGSALSQALDAAASDGSAVIYEITGGTLPDGLTLSNGTISGTPAAAGNATVTITASSGSATLEITLVITIAASAQLYYGYVPYSVAGSIQTLTAITQTMLEDESSSIVSASPAVLDRTSIGTVPAGGWIVVLIPAASGFTAAKYNGINGQTTFAPDNGAAGSGANGADVTLGGIAYKAYGELCLTTGEYFIYIND